MGDGDCVAGNYCDGLGQCAAKKPNGGSCNVANECQSDNCVDDFCCNTGCTNACDRCDQTGSEGLCSFATQGSSGVPSCAPYLCNGAIATCPNSCNFDSDCSSGNFCDTGSCSLKKANGQLCDGNNECGSGICTDGYCCDEACINQCDACNITGSEGSCTVAAAASAGSPSCAPYVCTGASNSCPSTCSGDSDCSAGNYCNASSQCVALLPNGANCSATNQCASSLCVDDYCCDNSCVNACDRCDIFGSEGSCSAVAQGSGGDPACTPFLCNGVLATCPTTCTVESDCATGNYCNGGGSCTAKLVDGADCNSNSECQSDHCIDGYCCDTACGASCDACDIAGSEGTCGFVATGAAGDPSCAPYLCDGTQAACPNSCMADSECVSTSFCNGTTCDGKKPNGQMCTLANECDSDNCVDGFCCNTGCTGACDACNLSGIEGVCSARPQGSTGDPACTPYFCNGVLSTCPLTCGADGDCTAGNYCDGDNCVAKQIDGSVCGANNECQSDNCVDGVCCNTSCGGACDACDIGGSVGTCSVVSASNAGDPSCAPYLCDGAAASCPATCSFDADCAAGNYCAGDSCVAKNANGALCNKGNECVSDNCIDGYCCNSGCTNACDACNLSGSEGTCSVLLDGTLGSPSCAPYVCDGAIATCPNSCVIHADCSSGNYCNALNQCVPQKGDGSTCMVGGECESGHCVDGFCCNTACSLGCDACDLTGVEGKCNVSGAGEAGDPSCSPYLCDGVTAACPSTCSGDGDCASTHYCDGTNCQAKQGDGSSCNAANQCQSDNCVDGFCCDTACSDTCDACNISGAEGTCSVNPIGSAGNPSCTPYLCDGMFTTCPSSCGSDGECASGFVCAGSACMLPSPLTNASYETGDYSGWTLTQSTTSGTWANLLGPTTVNDGDLLFDFFSGLNDMQNSFNLPVTFDASDGTRVAAWLVQGLCMGRMYQDVTIPMGATTLDWDMMYHNGWLNGHADLTQYLEISIRDPGTDAIQKSLFKTTNGVDPLIAPMSAYSGVITEFAGQTVRIDVTVQVEQFWFEVGIDNWQIL